MKRKNEDWDREQINCINAFSIATRENLFAPTFQLLRKINTQRFMTQPEAYFAIRELQTCKRNNCLCGDIPIRDAGSINSTNYRASANRPTLLSDSLAHAHQSIMRSTNCPHESILAGELSSRNFETNR